MLFYKTFDIADNERVLLFDRDRLKKVLGPGRHRLSILDRKIYESLILVFRRHCN